MRYLLNDLREAARHLFRRPRFLIVSSLTLALGVGAVGATYSVIAGVLFEPLSHPDPDRLVNIWSTAPGVAPDQFRLSPSLFLYFRRHNEVFDEIALFQRRRAALIADRVPEVVDVALTTQDYFLTLGASVRNGRVYASEEDAPGAPRVAVLSHRLWMRKFGGESTLIGRPLRIDGESTEVIGIAPAWLDETSSPDVWLPARLNEVKPSTAFSWFAVARLKAGVTPAQAAEHLAQLVQRAITSHLQDKDEIAFLVDGRYRPVVRDLTEDLIGNVREPLWIVFGAVGMVLLVACANVATLSLVRAESRQNETALRLALGCSPAALLRKLCMEAIVLALVGTVLGLVAAGVAVPFLVQLAPGTIPRLDHVRVDLGVTLVTAGAAMLATMVFGLLPAIRYSRPELLARMTRAGRGMTTGAVQSRGRQLLVVAQIALALALLIGSALLMRSFGRLTGNELGFVAKDVLTFQVEFSPAAYPKPADVVRVAQELADRLSDLPAVEHAGATTGLPIAGARASTTFEIDGRPVEAGQTPPIVNYSIVTPGFFESLGIRLLQGTGFDLRDLDADAGFVIINSSAAARFWPGQDPVGKRIRPAESTLPVERRTWYLVKGVVADVRHNSLRESARPWIYVAANPTYERLGRSFSYVLRTPRALERVESVRQTVKTLNPDLAIAAVQTMDRVIEQSVIQFRFAMVMLAVAAMMALVLAVVGIYGVLSYTVSQRTREIGVRIAIGATPSHVMRMVIGNAMTIAILGLVAGSTAAISLAPLLKSLLYDTDPLDKATFIAMSALLAVVALVAAYVPARRASTINPIDAMRAD